MLQHVTDRLDLGECGHGVFSGGDDARCNPPPHLWSDREFLDNFCTIFVSSVSRFNGKLFSGAQRALPPHPTPLDAYGALSPPH